MIVLVQSDDFQENLKKTSLFLDFLEHLERNKTKKKGKDQMEFTPIKIGNVTLEKQGPLTVICGPCVIETEEHALFCAEEIQKICDRIGVQLIYKASYDKANRSSVDSFRGPGLEKGLEILEKVRNDIGLPITTDIHWPEEASLAASVCQLLQIPAFLSRQTDLLLAAGKTHLPINIKKGQFLAPWDLRHVVQKILSTGNEQIILTERGTTFGYNNLVVDFRSIPIMQSLGVAVCFDSSHSVQLPGARQKESGGDREWIIPLTRAAIGAGANLLFIEAHPTPEKAKSDRASVVDFGTLERILVEAKALFSQLQHLEENGIR